MELKLSLFIIALWIAAAIGWVINIVKIVSSGFVIAEWGGMEVARIIGVLVAPLGAVLGWF